MTLLTFIAIVPLIVIAVLILTAAALGEPSPAAVAVLLLILWFVAFGSFKQGAKWQHANTLENYNLSPKCSSP